MTHERSTTELFADAMIDAQIAEFQARRLSGDVLARLYNKIAGTVRAHRYNVPPLTINTDSYGMAPAEGYRGIRRAAPGIPAGPIAPGVNLDAELVRLRAAANRIATAINAPQLVAPTPVS